LRSNPLLIDAVTAALASVPDDASIAVGFSGGIDSTVLLHATIAVVGTTRVSALHVHHGLSPHADRWLQHCRTIAQSFQVKFDSRRVQVERNSSLGLEAAARAVRYAALDEMSDACRAAVLLLGHHADDQAETVLLQMLRGAGLPGLAGMPSGRGKQPCPRRVRPLLTVLRASIEDYAHYHGLRWVDDESNQDQRFVRNALRAEILPRLAVHFPGYRDALGRSARHAAEAQGLLDELAHLDLLSVELLPGHRLSRAALNALSGPRASNLVRFWMRHLGLPAASAARLANLLHQIRYARPDASVRVDHAGAQLRIYRDEIWWETGLTGSVAVDPEPTDANRPKNSEDHGEMDHGEMDDIEDSGLAADPVALVASVSDGEASSYTISWRGESVWRLPAWRGTLVFVPTDPAHEDAIEVAWLERETLIARSRIGGERMRLAAARPARSLKNLFQEAGIPAWRREVPMIWRGTTLLFVPFLGLNRAAFDAVSRSAIAEPQNPDHASIASPSADRKSVRLEWRADLLIA
jgi:tRNA(Ile)-lysidine synthase